MKPKSPPPILVSSFLVISRDCAPLRRFALCSVALAVLVPGWIDGSAIAVAQEEKAPWLLTKEERAPFVNKADAAQGLVTVTNSASTDQFRPTEETLARMRTELVDLKAQLAGLPKDEFGLPPADAAIYAESVELQLKMDWWPAAHFEKAAFTCLRWGRGVVAGLKANPNFMKSVKHLAPLGYRSKVDRSAQPYLLALPEDYDPAAPGHYRLVVLLHGAYGLACPMGSIAGALSRAKDVNPGAITVTPFGRANGGYVWAAETDVWDVIEDMKRRFPIDDNQIVLTGFSMGGGGTLKLGLTHPGPFAACAALAPGMGGTSGPLPRANELPSGPKRWSPLTDAEISERVGCVYPGSGLAENGLGMPWMLGCGGADRLLQTQETVSKAFNASGVKYSSFVVPGVGHAGDTVMRQPEYRPFLLAHMRNANPREIIFATTTLKSHSRDWVRIEGLAAHYTKAIIHAVADPEKGTLTVTTDGIERFSLNPPESLVTKKSAVLVDGSLISTKATVSGSSLTFEKVRGKWRQSQKAAPALAKKPGLQGPVADAFTRGFLCVRPTGKPWNVAANNYAVTMLEALRTQWRTQAFGELPVKDDVDVTADDRARFDLILFGDPGSNRLIAEAQAVKSPWKIPLQWKRSFVELKGEKFTADSHLPALIYPSPFQAGNYVVFNGTPLVRGLGRWRDGGAGEGNALRVLPATLGDFAMLQVGQLADGNSAAKSVYGGFFDEQWK